MAVMECDRRVVGESDFDYAYRLDYNVRVPYDSYIECRSGFLCGKGEIFEGDDPMDIAEYLRDECSEEIYDGVAVVDKKIDDPGNGNYGVYGMCGTAKFPLPFMMRAATEYVDDE